MARINILISRKLYGLSINFVECLFSETKKAWRILVGFLKAVVFSFLFLVKKSQRIYIKRRVDYSPEGSLVVRDGTMILNKNKYNFLCIMFIRNMMICC